LWQVVQRSQPYLVDTQGPVEGVEHRQLEHRLAHVRSPVLQDLGKQQQLLTVVGQGLRGGILAGRDLTELRLERLAMGVGRLKREVGRVDLRPLRVGERQE
jgi:hypothetical protein